MTKLTALALVLALAAPISMANATTTKAVEGKAATKTEAAKEEKHHGKKHGKHHEKKAAEGAAAETTAPTEANSEIKPDPAGDESK